MKTFALLLLAALSGFAQAPWDGTKGNLTVKTLSDASHTAISVTESDHTSLLFSLTITYTVPCEGIGCTPLARTSTQYLPGVMDKFGAGPSAMFIFDMPIGQIKSVLITEWEPANTESLGAESQL